jgi:hypothetical protein
MLKKAANKISDEVNKNKWDHNSINSALFSSETDNSKFPPNPAATRPAMQQGGSVTGTAAPVPAVNMGAAPTPQPQPAPTSNPASVAAGTANTTAAPAQTAAPTPTPVQPQGYTKPVFRSRFAGPVKQNTNTAAATPIIDPAQKISNIGAETPVTTQAQAPVQSTPVAQQTAPVQQTPMVQQGAPVQQQTVPVQGQPVPQNVPFQQVPGQNPILQQTQPVQPVQPVIPENGYCYYVQIKHTKSYPAPKSIVMMRSCDHEYVWTDQQSETAKPAYPICPNCGKAISHTATEMDD